MAMKSAQKFRVWTWSEAKHSAAKMLAMNEHSVEEIAKACKVSPRCIWKWRCRPEFQAAIDSHVAAWRKAVLHQGISVKAARIEHLNECWLKMQAIIRERSTDPEMAKVAGGSTGLLVKRTKVFGAISVDEFVFDAPLLREMRETAKQAAIELGQFSEKRELTGANGGPVQISSEDIDKRLTETFHRLKKAHDAKQAEGEKTS